jgi:hypothetical protein
MQLHWLLGGFTDALQTALMLPEVRDGLRLHALLIAAR